MVSKGLVVGACGRFCSGCQFFPKKCAGCEKENKRLNEFCPIYSCVKEKRVKNCLQCPVTIPKCELMKSLTKSFCLVAATKMARGEI